MYAKVWSEAYELLGAHEGHTEAVTCLALDANFLFSGSEDFSVKVNSVTNTHTDTHRQTHTVSLCPFHQTRAHTHTF